MTHIESFIKNAIEGGWNPERGGNWNREGHDPVRLMKVLYPDNEAFLQSSYFHSWLLDPIAWQAVGKTRGWAMPFASQAGRGEYEAGVFFQNVMQGKSIEDALAALSE